MRGCSDDVEAGGLSLKIATPFSEVDRPFVERSERPLRSLLVGLWWGRAAVVNG